jgi:hypothetical protein
VLHRWDHRACSHHRARRGLRRLRMFRQSGVRRLGVGSDWASAENRRPLPDAGSLAGRPADERRRCPDATGSSPGASPWHRDVSLVPARASLDRLAAAGVALQAAGGSDDRRSTAARAVGGSACLTGSPGVDRPGCDRRLAPAGRLSAPTRTALSPPAARPQDRSLPGKLRAGQTRPQGHLRPEGRRRPGQLRPEIPAPVCGSREEMGGRLGEAHPEQSRALAKTARSRTLPGSKEPRPVAGARRSVANQRPRLSTCSLPVADLGGARGFQRRLPPLA